MAELTKAQQNYFNDLKRALGTGDEEMLSDLVRTKDPLAIRHDLSTTLGQHVRENYDDPLNIFHKKDILSEIPVEYDKLPSGVAGRFSRAENKIYLPHQDLEIPNRQMGVKLHEFGHADDALSGFSESQPFSKIKAKLEGLKAAEESIGKHHKEGMFEKYALENLLQNKKLGEEMTTDELMKHLQDYSNSVKSGEAKTSDFINIKNKIRQAYDAGNIDQPTMKQLGDKATGAFKNIGRESTLQALPEKVIEKGGSVAGAPGMRSRFADTLGKIGGEASSILKSEAGSTAGIAPMLGLGSLALGGTGVAKKLQEGDYGNAALDTADIASDFIPGVGVTKLALRPSELGNAELPPEIMQQRQAYNQSVTNPEQPDETDEEKNNKFKNILAKMR